MPTLPLLPVLLAALVGAAAAARHQLHLGSAALHHHHGRQVLSIAYPPSYPPPYYGGGHSWGGGPSSWAEDSDAWAEVAAVAGSRRAVLSTPAADDSEERRLQSTGLWGALEEVRLALLNGDGFDDSSLQQHSAAQRSLMSWSPGYYTPPPYGGAPIPDVWGDSAWGRRLQQLGDNSVWDEEAGSAPVGGYYPPGPYNSGPPCPGSYSPPEDDFGFRRLLTSADSPSEVLQALRSVGSGAAAGGAAADLLDQHSQLPMLDVPRSVAGASRGLKEWYDEPPSAGGHYGYGPSPPPYYGSGAGVAAAFTSDPIWGAARRSLMQAPSGEMPCGHYGYYHCAPPPSGDDAFNWPEHDGRKLQALREQLMME